MNDLVPYWVHVKMFENDSKMKMTEKNVIIQIVAMHFREVPRTCTCNAVSHSIVICSKQVDGLR